MRLDLPVLALGTVIFGSASAAARYFRRGMDQRPGTGAVGYVLALMAANIMQLLGLAVVIAGLFGGP